MDSSSSPSSAALSIYELARLHSRERLLVDPVEWTSRHIELLQCTFEEPTPAPPLTSQPSFTGDESDACHSERLSTSRSYARHSYLISLIADWRCPFTFRSDIGFYFNQHFIRELPCVVFFPGNEVASAAKGEVPPAAAYVDRKCVNGVRARKFGLPAPGKMHKTLAALFDIKLKKLIPKEPLHDPYIVALLICLAQEQRRTLKATKHGEQANPSTFLSQVFFTDDNDHENIYLYSTNIASSFLDKLDYPAASLSTLPPPTLSIRHTIIPFKPFETFRDRILGLLIPTSATPMQHLGDEAAQCQSGEHGMENSITCP